MAEDIHAATDSRGVRGSLKGEAMDLTLPGIAVPQDVQFTRAGLPANDLKSGNVITARNYLNGASGTLIISAGITFVGNGVYRVMLTLQNAGDEHFLVFETTDATVDRRSIKSEGVRAPLWVNTIYNKVALISGMEVSGATPAFASFNTELEAPVAVRWEKSFDLDNFVSDTWQAWVFTVKANADSDDDSSALLTIRKSNPAQAVSDGILVFNRRAVAAADALRLAGAINVLTATPDTLINIVLTAAATDLPPSSEADPYAWELNLWRGGDKERIGYGTFKMPRSVRRETIIP